MPHSKAGQISRLYSVLRLPGLLNIQKIMRGLRFPLLAGVVLLSACIEERESILEPVIPPPASQNRTLTIVGTGNGSGRVQSATGLINCTISAGGATSGACSATLPSNLVGFGLTATPSTGSSFSGWAAPCQPTSNESCTLSSASLPATLTASFVVSSTGTSTSVDLGITPIAQSLSQWCWLASGEMVFRYYGVRSVNPVSYQCGVLAMLAGVQSACWASCTLCNAGAPSIQYVHYMVVTYPQYANLYFGGGVRQLRASWTSTPLSDSQIRQELDARRPIIAGVSPSGFRFSGQVSEHAVVIVGYRVSGGTVSFIVNDPWPYGSFAGQQDPYLSGGATQLRPGQYLISSNVLRQRLVLREAVYAIS